MTTLLQRTERLSHSIEVLDEVADGCCNLAVWERAPITGADAVIDLARADVRFTAPLASLDQALRDHLSASGFADSVVRDALIADVFELAQRYCSILKLDHLEVRLEMITTNSCRKFHADYVRARLITTYVGAGTDWLDSEDAARVKQGLEPLHINSLRAGDVGLFKGKLATKTPAIHRSPPITGTGQRRLLLVLNPPEER
jgi:hypothetical protein